jgi:competence protein ComEC
MLTAYRKICWNRLKRSSVYKALLNNWFLAGLFLVLAIASYKSVLALGILLVYSRYLYKQDKRIFLIGIVITAIFAGRFAYMKLTYRVVSTDEVIGYVRDVKTYEKYNRLTVQSGNKKYYVYDSSFAPVDIGNRIAVRGTAWEIEGAHVPGGFDYRAYLRSRRISGAIRADEIAIVGRRFELGMIRQKVQRYLGALFAGEALGFLQAIILGDSGLFTDEFQEAVKINGISHLFAISGLHVGFVVVFLHRIFRALKIRQERAETIILGILFLYAVLVNFTPSIIRAVLLYDGYYLNKKLKMGLSSLDLLTLIFIALLLVNPYYLYNSGFVLSFTVTFIIIVTSPLLAGTKHLTQLLLISVFSWTITLPVVVNINNEINILSPLVNLVYIDLVGYIILPLSFAVMALPLFARLYSHVVKAFINFTVFLSNNFVLRFTFPDFSFTLTVSYYLLLAAYVKTFTVKKRRYAVATLLLLLLLASANSIIFKPHQEIVFLDLYNGESTLISDRCNRCNVLIDTGDGRNGEVTAFLKKRGIKRIDYLIITHDHADHNGEAALIIKEFAVNNIVVGAYDNSGLSQIANLKVKKGDKIVCGSFVFDILHPDGAYADENDNSIIVHVKVGEHYFLFLGDVGAAVEEKISMMSIPVDVIKIAHHGSATATSPEMIARLRPRYAVIQTGRISQFGFPAKRTIATLERYDIIIYRTDLNYTVTYKYHKKKSIFATIK